MVGERDHQTCDIAIVGASFAGLALARALSVASEGALSIQLVDTSPALGQKQPRHDPRAFALSAASRYLLQHIAIWPSCAPVAQPVEHIEITDSSLDAGVRPVRMAWDNLLPNGDPASYIVPAEAVLSALRESVAADGAISILSGQSARAGSNTPHTQSITLRDGREITAKLVVAADGGRSPLRSEFGIQNVKKSYGQRGIVTTLRHEKPHHATAVQHFLPGGPFAILPLTDDQSCITWSEEETEADRIVALDAAQFSAALDTRLAGRLGVFDVVVPPQTWPLTMHLARSYIADRFVLVGDAAHGVHPLAGQGLNLGLRDVAALVDVVLDAARLGLDFGAPDVLQRYQQWRRSDSTLNAFAYDGINKLFSNDISLLRSLREVGLGAVDRLEGLKSYFVTEAAGQSGEVPALMRKEAA